MFPFTVFQEHLVKFGKYGLLNATFILPLQMEELNSDSLDGQFSDAFKKRIRDIVSDMYRLGYI